MYKIQTLNKIAAIGTDRLDAERYTVSDAETAPDAILVRSAKMHDTQFNPELLCIARAGAGTNNIPSARCAEEGIVVFNTPGANAEGVKELALAALIFSARDVFGGMEWVKTIAGTPDVAAQVEKGKAAFVGREIKGKTLGVIGLGAIGAKLANDAIALGMSVIGIDPYISVGGALRLSPLVKLTNSVADIYKNADYISIHVPYIASGDGATHHYINADALAQMKSDAVILNMARAELVDDDAMLAALESGSVLRYVTDFPNDKTAGAKGVIALPHLGASTPESEDNCAIMAVNQTVDYIENGNIVNSVNYPALSVPRSGSRICVLGCSSEDLMYKVTQNDLARKTDMLGFAGAKRGDFVYMICDYAKGAELAAAADAIRALDGVIRVRVID